ncbi:hypothetical protein NEMIN01_1488 [Nematocida minor]|uniref:uncharacterized protein n=1 Tax=Nematocida minor TaxID=1912983 RepID=UPI002220898F|nr:uncharacterized protein NEMIN01_1488 [Nematocida minor]KAI5191329.1 hypothetical protein NEMIN01_1488 [Nematocida minor]
MKNITACVQYKKEYIYATYVYSEKRRHGCITYKNTEIETTGTFDLSLDGDRLIASNSNSMMVIDLGKKESLEGTSASVSAELYSTVYENGINNYKHCLHRDKLYSVGLGVYSEIDLHTGSISKHTYYCNNSKCIHDILSIVVDDKYIYIGCDIGCLSYIDRKTHETVHTVSYSGGVTWLNTISNKKDRIDQSTDIDGVEGASLEVGTYSGEYSLISGNFQKIDKNTGGIIWRVYKTTVNGNVYNILAQSYDGIGIYTEDMVEIRTVPTDDLVYTVKIDEESKVITGYNYYKGTLIKINLYEAIDSAKNIQK